MERTVFLVYTVNGQKQFVDCFGETQARGLIVNMLKEGAHDLGKSLMLDKLIPRNCLIELIEAVPNDNRDESSQSLYQNSKYAIGDNVLFKIEASYE